MKGTKVICRNCGLYAQYYGEDHTGTCPKCGSEDIAVWYLDNFDLDEDEVWEEGKEGKEENDEKEKKMTREKLIENIEKIREECCIGGLGYASYPELWMAAYKAAIKEKDPEEIEHINICADPTCGPSGIHAHVYARDGSGYVYPEDW